MMKNYLMRRVILVLTSTIIIVFCLSACSSGTKNSATQQTEQKKKLIGYYTSMSAYSGYTPDKIDATKFTNINYSFANIGKDLKIAIGDPAVDESNFKLLKALKEKNPNLKTLISIGGWTWSAKFSDAALTDASRTAFADSCVDFITRYGFDGVDIDWEYPVSGGLTGNTMRDVDKKDFTLLLQKLREKLDARGLIDNKHYLLTIAGGCESSYISNTEISVIQQYLDYANIMTYDIHGTSDTYTDFNAPLYENSNSSNQDKWSVDSGINAWLKAGFPADKLVLGIPFYGYKYGLVKNANDGLYQTFSGVSSLSYDSIAENYINKAGYTRYWDEKSMVPWLFNGSTFISYEDQQSIGIKAEYIKSRGLAGAMIWEISEDRNEVLFNVLYDKLK